MAPSHPVNPTDFFSLIQEAGWVAKLTLLLLFSSSIICWGVILSKWRVLTAILKTHQEFLTIFRGGKNLEEVLSKTNHLSNSPLSSILHQGVRELKLILNAENTASTDKLDNIQRALFRASTQEVTELEKNLGWLATTASTAPFIGLFGTVWGIMNAFQSIGASGAANLAIVAPGISEALITTAMGIAAAIPAVIAYNYFTGQIRKLAVEMECFSQELTNIIQRHFFHPTKKGT